MLFSCAFLGIQQQKDKGGVENILKFCLSNEASFKFNHIRILNPLDVPTISQ